MVYSEELDIVDEYDNVVGKCTREEAHKRGEIHRSVVWFVFDDQKRLFCNQRATKGKSFLMVIGAL
jgi:isopentenyldiphosphate isomerase